MINRRSILSRIGLAALLAGAFSQRKSQATYLTPSNTVIATANQAITSSDVLANSTYLTMPIEANQKYIVDLLAHFTLAGIVSGYKFDLNGPASPTNVRYLVRVINGVAFTVLNVSSQSGLAASIAGALATTGDHMIEMTGVIENGANAGNLVLRIAQNVSDGSAITLLRGSKLLVKKI